jgi:hypothetical protein
MSLDKAAKHLAAHGRGPDTELVHMTKDEVKGLQQLAMAHGGSLTINPHTGLAEAGFLSRILPTVAGVAAGAATGNPMIGAAVAGGMTAATTGSLQQGIIAGGMAYAGSEFLGPGTRVAPAPITDMSTAFVPPTTTPTVAPTVAPPAEVVAPVVSAPVTPPAPVGGPGFTVDQMIAGSGRPELSGLSNTFDPYAKIPGENLGFTQAPDVKKGFFGSLTNPQKVALGGTGLLATMALANQAGNKGLPQEPTYASSPRLSKDFQGSFPAQPRPYYRATYAASGGLMAAGPVEAMSQANMNNFYPQGQMSKTQYATPSQMPTSAEVVNADYEPRTELYNGNMVRMAPGGSVDKNKKKKASLTTAAKLAAMDPYEASVAGLGNAMYHSQMPSDVAKGLQPTMDMGKLNLAEGGHLGSYSDGGRLLKGPGDGVSDDIPARIGKHQPARLADGEFVIPARIVSELGNGSTDAGARKLYEMMDRVQASRKKSIGKGKFAVNSKAAKHLPKK